MTLVKKFVYLPFSEIIVAAKVKLDIASSHHLSILIIINDIWLLYTQLSAEWIEDVNFTQTNFPALK